MSYAALRSFGADECPPGWAWDAEAKVCRSSEATMCPTGFDQRVPGECWPSVPSACKVLFGNMFFNPAEPDRCKPSCPVGTVADVDNVCRPGSVVSPVTIVGMIVLGVVGLAVVLKGGR